MLQHLIVDIINPYIPNKQIIIIFAGLCLFNISNWKVNLFLAYVALIYGSLYVRDVINEFCVYDLLLF